MQNDSSWRVWRRLAYPSRTARAFRARAIDFDEAVEQRSQEDVALAVAEQDTRKKTYLALKSQGLPIDEQLEKDFAPRPCRWAWSHRLPRRTVLLLLRRSRCRVRLGCESVQ